MAQYIVCVEGEPVTDALEAWEAEAARSEYPGAELVEVPEQFDPDELSDNERSFFNHITRICIDPSNPTANEEEAIDYYRAYCRLLPNEAQALRNQAADYRFRQQAGY